MRPRHVLPLLLLAVLSGLAQTPGRRSSCEICHSKTAADHQVSKHRAAGLTCITCHGGDPNDVTATAMSRSKGFRGKPSRLDQPSFCANCHAQHDLMQPYGLPTNQYADYQQSTHGKQLAKGDTKVAVCTDCHTSHAIRKVDDPLASVSRTNLPQTCARCHEDKALMASRGIPAGQYTQYASSVHGMALLQGQSKTAPTCASCHGSHGAAPPAAKSVQHVCAQCHPNIAEAFESGPHGTAAAAGKMAPCVSCHGAHDIKHPTDELLDTACAKCHPADSPALVTGQRIKAEITKARELFKNSDDALASAHGTGLATEQRNAQLGEAKTALLLTAAAQHAMRPRDVERRTAVVRATDEDIRAARHGLREQYRIRVAVLAYIWGFLLVSIVSLGVVRQRSQREWLQARANRAER